MINIIGWLGVGLLILSYIFLSVKKFEKWFIPVDTIASGLLTIHALIICDIPFIIVNGFIFVALARKWYMRQLEVN